MVVNNESISTIANYLNNTLSPDVNVRKPAEDFLRSVETQLNFPLLILTIIGNESIDSTIKVAASITFKNYIKRNWKVTEDDDKDNIDANDRLQIKQLIVNLMLKSSSSIQNQLSAAIAFIGESDFPSKWPELLPALVCHFQSDTFEYNIINGCLQTAVSIFQKYAIEMKSQKLWEEIKFVLDNFAAPLTELFNKTMKVAETHSTNKEAVTIIFGSLVLISKLFYLLNYQDLPEFFEDNMNIWMTHFHTLLTIDNAILKTDNDDEPGVLEGLKSQICDNIGLYAHKYEEEFANYMRQFVTAVWNLLLATGPALKYDLLSSNAIQFLASVADRQQYKVLFEDDNILGSICEKIIVPNMELRPVDVEIFEDNGEEYIRRDLEGSDLDTRRRAACDLVKGLSRYFEDKITSIFGSYVKNMLGAYDSDPVTHWRSKDAAIYLVTSLAARAKTAKHGITQTNTLVDLNDFCEKCILSELEIGVETHPILKADAAKYILTFRSQLRFDLLQKAFPLCIHLLRAPNHVVHSYAASTIEKLLLLKAPDGSHAPLFNNGYLAPFAESLLTALFAAFSLEGSSENEYVMKTIMRSFSSLQEAVVPYLASLLPLLTQKILLASKNPTRPHYNHYAFESLGLSIRIVCKTQPEAVSNFESVLFPVFQGILQEDVQEFVPYVFQILSLCLELHQNASIPQPYMELFPFLLMPVLWERPGNITALVRLIQAYVSRGPTQVVASNKNEALLGVFQKLVASKANDHEGFYLMQSMIEHFPPDVMSPYIKPIFLLLFQRLTSSKTTKFVKSFLVLLTLFVVKYNGALLIQTIDSLQGSMFAMVIERLFLLELQKVSGSVERKIVAVGLTKLLCETPEMISGSYSSYWPQILNSLIGLFELPEDESIPDDEHFIEIEETAGYRTAYSQLVFAGKRNTDPLTTVDDPRINLASSLHKLSVSSPGLLSPLISRLEVQAQQFLQQYLIIANVTLM